LVDELLDELSGALGLRLVVVVLECHFVRLTADFDPSQLVDLVDRKLVAVSRVLPLLRRLAGDRNGRAEHDRVGRERGQGHQKERRSPKPGPFHRKPSLWPNERSRHYISTLGPNLNAIPGGGPDAISSLRLAAARLMRYRVIALLSAAHLFDDVNQGVIPALI